MNNLEMLKDMISEYNEEMLLASFASADHNKDSENKYRHGAYILAQFIKRITTALGLEIEQFDKKIEYLGDNCIEVKLNVPQIRINSQR